MILLMACRKGLNFAYLNLFSAKRTIMQNICAGNLICDGRRHKSRRIFCNKPKYKVTYFQYDCNWLKKSSGYLSSNPEIFQQLQVHGPFKLDNQKRTFHTSNRRATHPVLVFLLRPLAKLLPVLFGRAIRVWWSKLPKREKYRVLETLEENKYHIWALFAAFGAGAVFFYASHLEVEPLTQRRRFIAFSEDQVKEIAYIDQEVVLEKYQDCVLSKKHPVFKQVAAVAMHILRSNKDIEKIKNTKWSVIVIDSLEERNAFVLPTGTIFMFTGMLAICDNLDQVGIILSHEIAHVLLSHMSEQISRMYFGEFLLIIPIAIIWALFPDMAALITHWFTTMFFNTVINLPFSRKLESEADEIGLMLAAKSCLDVREAVVFWERMKMLSGNETEGLAEFLSTHPAHETRKNFLNSRVPEALQLREICQCPKLPSNDPRDLFKITSRYKNDGHYIIRI